MAISKKLETIYHNGQPDGIRSIRRNLSTMTTYVIPRPLLSEAKNISGITRPGIYYLINESDDNRIAQIYIGQTRNGINRLDDHNRSKDFWNKAIMFLAESKTFTLEMISGLEKFAIMKAQEPNDTRLKTALFQSMKLNEYDLVAVEEIYDEIQFIMATQGYKMDDAKRSINEERILHTTRNGIAAAACMTVRNLKCWTVLRSTWISRRICRAIIGLGTSCCPSNLLSRPKESTS